MIDLFLLEEHSMRAAFESHVLFGFMSRCENFIPMMDRNTQVLRSVNDLANRARSKKLQPDDVKGGTFTLTNHGISGSLFAFPVINQPQCGILGVGAMQKRVVVTEDDAIAIRPMIYLSFVFDHRILDGASADWFLAKVKETLENWS